MSFSKLWLGSFPHDGTRETKGANIFEAYRMTSYPRLEHMAACVRKNQFLLVLLRYQPQFELEKQCGCGGKNNIPAIL